MFDFKKGNNQLNHAKVMMVIWGLSLGVIALVTQTEFAKENVLTLGLSIASILYGGILGLFLIGKFGWDIKENQLLISLFTGIFPIFLIWIYQLSSGQNILGWTLFIPIGTSITLLMAKLLKTR